MKAFYDNVPSVMEAVGGGAWRFRWNIENVKDEDGQTGNAGWSCEEVTVYEPLSANKITEAVITQKVEPNYEQKLINDYNAAQMGITSGDEAKTAKERYKAFLTARAELKAQVDKDCQSSDIA